MAGTKEIQAPPRKTKLSAALEENNHLESLVKAKQNTIEYMERELADARRLFMEMYKDKRTKDMRFTWLETAAEEVITSCKDHQADALVRLADEIGLEYKPELFYKGNISYGYLKRP